VIEDVLARAGIPATPEPWAECASGTIYTVRASDASTARAWVDDLASEAGWFALAIDLEPDGLFAIAAAPAHARALEAAREHLAILDAWRPAPDDGTAPARARALLGWRTAHPDGAPLASLVDALHTAPRVALPSVEWAGPIADDPHARLQTVPDTLTVALVPARHGHEVLSLLQFGRFNACPATARHVACAQRWERDLGARLAYVAHDSYAFAIARPPDTDEAVARAVSEIAQLFADERPASGALRRASVWHLWWA
jgi:hypothetical protein